MTIKDWFKKNDFKLFKIFCWFTIIVWFINLVVVLYNLFFLF